MMRERKYRAWDGERMYYATFEDLVGAMGPHRAGDWSLEEEVGEELAGFAGRRDYPYGDREVVYSEWVGIEDIYEGDIVENDTIGVRGVITWVKTYPGWIILPHLEKTGAYVIHNEWKVLGNIWQNSDLLLSS